MPHSLPEKPKAGALARGARAFIRDNKDYFKLYIKPLIVPMVVCLAILQIGMPYFSGPYMEALKARPVDLRALSNTGLPFMAFGLVAGVFSAYFQACFALSWHRAVLLGPKLDYAVNPFSLKPGESGFIAAFFLVILIPFLVMGGGGAALGVFAAALHQPALAGLCVILMGVLVIYGVILSMRMMFMLPARSVNARISWHEARQISRGLLWKLVWAGFWWTVAVALLFGLWSGVVQGVGYIIFGRPVVPSPGAVDPVSIAAMVYMFVFVTIPQVLVRFYLTAFGVTILSRLYQWSLQNRPLVSSSSKDNTP